MTFHGKIEFEPGAPAFRGANLIVRLEETSQADAEANLIAEAVIRDVSWSGDPAERVTFSLDVPAPLLPRHRYELRAHVDTSCTNEVTRGDFLTTQSYPVTPGSPEMNLRVKWLA